MGLLFDLTAFFRRLMGSGRLATACADLAFWLFSAAMTFAMLMQANRGEVRVFVLAGIAAGFWVYSVTVRYGVSPVLLWCEWAVQRSGHSTRRICRWGPRAVGRMNRAVRKGFLKMRRTLPQLSQFAQFPQFARLAQSLRFSRSQRSQRSMKVRTRWGRGRSGR